MFFEEKAKRRSRATLRHGTHQVGTYLVTYLDTSTVFNSKRKPKWTDTCFDNVP
jgi:hypothetical protein